MDEVWWRDALSIIGLIGLSTGVIAVLVVAIMASFVVMALVVWLGFAAGPVGAITVGILGYNGATASYRWLTGPFD